MDYLNVLDQKLRNSNINFGFKMSYTTVARLVTSKTAFLSS